MRTMDIARDTAVRDLTGLIELGLLDRLGFGRGVKYMLKAGSS